MLEFRILDLRSSGDKLWDIHSLIREASTRLAYVDRKWDEWPENENPAKSLDELSELLNIQSGKARANPTKIEMIAFVLIAQVDEFLNRLVYLKTTTETSAFPSFLEPRNPIERLGDVVYNHDWACNKKTSRSSTLFILIHMPDGSANDHKPNISDLAMDYINQIHFLYVEEQDVIDVAAIRDIIKMTTLLSDEYWDGKLGCPDLVRDPPPSPWGTLSFLRYWSRFAPASKRRLDSNVPPPEFRDPASEEKLRKMLSEWNEAVAYSPFERILRSEANKIRVEYLLRVCRHLAVLNVEGRPFRCSILITDSELNFEDLKARIKTNSRIFVSQCLKRTASTPFHLFRSVVREYVETAQSVDLIMLVSAERCHLERTISIRVTASDRGRAYGYRQLAEMGKGLLAHVRGHGLVELYDKEDLQLLYDGFSWQVEPFRRLVFVLRKFYSKQRTDKWTRRIIGAVMHLFDEHASSILVFANEGIRAQLKDKNSGLAYLKPMRDDIVLHEIGDDTGRIKSGFSLDALASILRVDGAHIIDDRANVMDLAYQINSPEIAKTSTDGKAGMAGTGRMAAKAISEHFTKIKQGFVVKVSASRRYYIFHGGREIDDSAVAFEEANTRSRSTTFHS